jgi:hypothetical protein
MAYHFNISKDINLLPEQLTSIEGVITTKPKIKRRDNSISFELSQYPNFTFQISGKIYFATHTEDFVSNVNAKDTIAIDILTDDYEKKLTRDKEMNYLDKSINYRFISIYGLRANGYTFLSLKDYNKEKKSDDRLGVWFFGLLGMYFFYLSLRQIKKKSKNLKIEE